MFYILILHYAALTAPAGVLYDSAAVIGPMDNLTCQQMVGSNTNPGVGVVCSTRHDYNYALDSYGCKVRESTPHKGFTETTYTCE